MSHDDPILHRAFERMEELEQELIKLREFVSTYRTLANNIKLESSNILGTKEVRRADGVEAVDKVQMELVREAPEVSAPPPRRTRVTDNPKPAVVVAAAVDLIRENLRPMSRRDIWEGLRDRGIVVKGADPVKALGTMLWRSGADDLVQLEGFGYWLKREPYPVAGYDPVMKEEAVNSALKAILLS